MSNQFNATTSRLNGFDYFVLLGASVNLVVILCLIVFWLIAG